MVCVVCLQKAAGGTVADGRPDEGGRSHGESAHAETLMLSLCCKMDCRAFDAN